MLKQNVFLNEYLCWTLFLLYMFDIQHDMVVGEGSELDPFMLHLQPDILHFSCPIKNLNLSPMLKLYDIIKISGDLYFIQSCSFCVIEHLYMIEGNKFICN